MDALLEATEDVYSLTPIQKGALLHSVSSREAADLYVVQLVADLSAPVDTEAFEQAWTQAVERHPALRSAFVWEEFDDPLQIVQKEAALKVTRFDWAERSAEEVEAEFRRYLDADRQAGISLLDPPLARLALFQLAGGDVRFVFTFHTLILDGWSKGVLLKEVLEAYEPRLAGQPVSSSREGSAYRSYVAWSQAQEHDKSESFWRHTLEGFDQPLHLAGGSNDDAGFGDTAVTLVESEVSALTSLARERRLTLNNIVQAAWGLLLGHLGDVDDVVFGAAVSGRPTDLPGADSILGLMINTVPVRVGIDSRKSADHWLKDLQQEQNEYRNHENVPLSQIRSCCALPPSTPLFESVILFENWPHVELLSRFRNLRFEPLVRTLYPVTLCVLPQGEKLLLHIAYDRRRLGHDVANRLLEGLRSILQRLPGAGERNIADLVDGLPGRGLFSTVEAARQAAERSEEFKPPRTETEAAVAAICAELLGLERISVEVDLFTLGGHSLFAAQLSARLGDLHGIELPLHAIFSNATVAGVAEAVEKLREASDGAGSSSLELPQVAADVENQYESFPLTDTQQAYWVGRSGALGSSALVSNVYLEIRCEELDLPRFDQAWNRLVERHDMLRVVVLSEGRQQILKRVPAFETPFCDLRDRDETGRKRFLDEQRFEMMRGSDSPDQWPLFDVRATQLADQDLRLHFCFDLLNIDAGSVSILFRELASYYDDDSAQLPELEISFRDYVMGEEAFTASEAFKRAESYWRERLPELPQVPDFPLAKDPATLEAVSFERYSATLNADAWSRLKAKAARQGLTSSGILLAAFAQSLTTWSRNQRLTINIPLFNRFALHAQVDQMVGDFTTVNLLAVDHSHPESFEARARRLQEQLWKDLDNRYMNGVRVMRELAASQGQSGGLMTVVFTSLLDLHYTSGMERFGSLVDSATQTSQVLVDHQVREEDGALVYHWDIVEGLFPEGFLEAMFASYSRFLEDLADEDDWRAAHFDLLPEADKALLGALNDTNVEQPEGMIHTELARWAERQPDHPAVITADRTISYGELAAYANRIGRRLRELGAAPDQPVAVVMEKGWEQVAAAFGAFVSGAPYLPIDPSFPSERIKFLLTHGQVKVALTQTRVESNVQWPEAVQPICVDDPEIQSIDDSPLKPVQTPRNLAYVLYTSGSTGEPKGAMIEHRSVVNRMRDVAERFDIGPSDRAIAVTSMQHDLSVFDMCGMIIAGGSIVVPDEAQRRDPAHWAELILKTGVTVWNSVPAFMEMFLDYLDTSPNASELAPTTLRRALHSGDWVPVSLPGRIRAVAPQAQVISLGGPTETTVWDICYPIGDVDPAWKSIPYGRPMANAGYHVLNEALETCPVNVPGELYICGVGLGRGYWRDEEKTRKTFIVHPRSGERLYKSGDRGRVLPDGQIEILGRVDFQLKIRGYRIEPGEIESAIRQHPRVKDAVVIATGDNATSRRLVAYVVPRGGDAAGSKTAEPESQPACYVPPEAAGMLEDPLERMEFKLSHLNVRKDAGDGIALPEQSEEERQAEYVLRQSYRSFSDEPVSLERFSRFISCLSTLPVEGSPFPKYRYPSAGSLYPLQVYLHVKPDAIEGVPAGTYYYHPEEHRLVALTRGAKIDRSVHTANNLGIFDQAGFSVFLLGQFNAVAPMYGGLARDYCLLEAGYIGQLMMTASQEQAIGLCPLGGVDFDRIRDLFDLDDGHVFLHGMLGGAIAPAQMQSFSYLQEGQSASAPTPQSTSGGAGPLEPALRPFLAAKLPEYMTPSAIIELDEIPRTPNGKINRRGLPDPVEAAPSGQQARVGVESPYVEEIRGVVQHVVSFGQIEANDSLLQRGMTSLEIVRVINLLEKDLGFRPRINEFFSTPTLAFLAGAYERHLADKGLPPPSVKSETEALPRRDERVQERRLAQGASAQRLGAEATSQAPPPPSGPSEAAPSSATPTEQAIGSTSSAIRMGESVQSPQALQKGDPQDTKGGPAGSATVKPHSDLEGEPFWRGLKKRLLQVLALYAPGRTTLRARLHRMRGVRMGEGVVIGLSSIIETKHPELVQIGNGVEIGPRVVIIAHFRETTNESKLERRPNVRIEDHVFIGPGAIILPNVTIGRGSVVTAGSVVTESVPPQTMVQGNPAKPVARCESPLTQGTFAEFLENVDVATKTRD